MLLSVSTEIKEDIQLQIFITAVVLIVILLIWRFPPKKRGAIGYKTPQAFKSEEHWDLAQRHAGKIGTLIFAMILTIEFGFYFIKGATADTKKTITIMMVSSVAGIILSTEIELWKLSKKIKQSKSDKTTHNEANNLKI